MASARPRIAAPLAGLARPLSSMLSDPRNARRHPEENLLAIERSLTVHGQVKPVVVREGVVVAGNGTLEAARRLGWNELAAVEFDGTEAQARAFAVADNRTAELATWDDAALAEVLREADGLGLLEGTGFAAKDLDRLLAAGHEKNAVADPAPVPATESKAGETFRLGRHVLYCGDATERDLLGRLCHGRRLSCVWTDPPYGMDVGLRKARSNVLFGGHRPTKDLEGDGADASGLPRLLRIALDPERPEIPPGTPYFVCGPTGPTLPVFVEALSDLGIYRQTLAWVKAKQTVSGAHFQHRWEALFYGWSKGPCHPPDDRGLADVIEVPAPPRAAIHPTEKPVELVKRCLLAKRVPDGLVYDPFAVSGTVLAAAEEVGMVAVLVEKDPQFCDVVRKRWEGVRGGLA